MFVVAGHGILKDGMQYVALNEFDSSKGFYKIINIEGFIRSASEVYNTNAYFISFFACCRQIYMPQQMKGQVQASA